MAAWIVYRNLFIFFYQMTNSDLIVYCRNPNVSISTISTKTKYKNHERRKIISSKTILKSQVWHGNQMRSFDWTKDFHHVLDTSPQQQKRKIQRMYTFVSISVAVAIGIKISRIECLSYVRHNHSNSHSYCYRLKHWNVEVFFLLSFILFHFGWSLSWTISSCIFSAHKSCIFSAMIHLNRCKTAK